MRPSGDHFRASGPDPGRFDRSATPWPGPCYDGHSGTDFTFTAVEIDPRSGQIVSPEVLRPDFVAPKHPRVDVLAAAPGVVLAVGYGGGGPTVDGAASEPVGGDFSKSRPFWRELEGWATTSVVVRQDDGRLAAYAGLDGDPVVRPQQRVACGQKLGTIGIPPELTVGHLHFEVRSPSDAVPRVDPAALPGEILDPFPDLWSAWEEGDLPAPTCAGR